MGVAPGISTPARRFPQIDARAQEEPGLGRSGRHFMRPRRRLAAGRDKGFTLIEVLVVVAIIAMLIAVLLPALAMSRAAARNAGCLARLHDLSLGTVMYARDYLCVP